MSEEAVRHAKMTIEISSIDGRKKKCTYSIIIVWAVFFSAVPDGTDLSGVSLGWLGRWTEHIFTTDDGAQRTVARIRGTWVLVGLFFCDSRERVQGPWPRRVRWLGLRSPYGAQKA